MSVTLHADCGTEASLRVVCVVRVLSSGGWGELPPACMLAVT